MAQMQQQPLELVVRLLMGQAFDCGPRFAAVFPVMCSGGLNRKRVQQDCKQTMETVGMVALGFINFYAGWDGDLFALLSGKSGQPS